MAETPGVQSETLAQRMAQGPLDPETALEILKRLLKTLALLHWTGAVHGGISPKVINIGPNGQVTLTGGKLEAEAERTTKGSGNKAPLHPGYMAPEQVIGHEADARTDVFVVGVIGYEMLTGANPFGADTGISARQVMSHVLEGPSPELPPAVLAQLPAYAGDALAIALAKDPDRRFANAESFLGALDDRRERAEVAAPTTAGGWRRRGAVARYYVLPSVAAVVTLAVVLAIIFSMRDPAEVSQTTVSTVTTSAPTTATTAPPTTTTIETPTTTTAASTTTTLPPAAAATRFEEDVDGLSFAGDWAAGTDPQYSGGSFQYADGAGTAVTASFYGTSLAWIAKQGPSYGRAKLTIDGGTPTTVDLYAAQVLYQQTVWTSGTLSDGLHTVKIEWTGDKDEAASGANICVDALDITGQLVDVTRFEQNDTRLDWAGAWKTTTSVDASGGSFQFVDEAGATVTIDFTGVALDIIAKKGPLYGQATIILDGTETFSVDLYSADVGWGLTVWSSGLLTEGDHTVSIKWAGTKNDAATGTNINLDAVDVMGDLR